MPEIPSDRPSENLRRVNEHHRKHNDKMESVYPETRRVRLLREARSALRADDVRGALAIILEIIEGMA
jgi:hypothetical protein